MDLFNLDAVGMLIHFINKKSLLPVTELDNESGKLLEMVGQQVLVGVTYLSSKDARIRDQSKELVEKILPAIAPTLYRGVSVATVDFARARTVMQQMELTEADMPIVYITDTITQYPIRYKGKLEQNDLRKWAQDQLKESSQVNAEAQATS